MNNLFKLNDLSFSYDSERKILENFDLCINAGNKVLRDQMVLVKVLYLKSCRTILKMIVCHTL